MKKVVIMNSSLVNRWWIVALAGVLVYLLALAATAASAEEKGACDEQRWGCFSGGTYGRVQPSWNLRGGSGSPANLVSHGTRIELPPYAEVDFYYRKTLAPAHESPVTTGAVVTVGFLEDLFHFTGDFEQSLALRNLYGWARGLGNGRVDIWAGSRMVRGDDIYLVDWWPLDNLNTYGTH